MRRRVHGYTDLGPKQIPPLPIKTALIDRSNSKTYTLAKNGSVPSLTEITDTTGYLVYGSHDGPSVLDDTGNLQRLYASGGTLSFEALDQNYRQPVPAVLVAKSPLDVWKVTIESGALALEEVV